MYAQLCKQLSEHAPNFESDVHAPCTFRQLLLKKCKDEFENRSRVSDQYERSCDKSLSAEEEEQRLLAKRKMLGNIKFIGELGKLEMLQEAILHKCVQQLLAKKKRHHGDMAEDLECLCQIMRTCGRLLDTDKAKSLVSQYFERMEQLASNPELPSRIRFMLQDVIELRQNGWRPRKLAQERGPTTIQEIREEAARDLGVYIPAGMKPGSALNMAVGPFGPIGPLAASPSSLFSRPSGKTLEDMFCPGSSTLGTGPGVISPDLSFISNGVVGSTRNIRGVNNHYSRPVNTRPQQYPNFGMHNNSNHHQQGEQHNNQLNHQYSQGVKDLPPRFKKMYLAQQQQSGGASREDISLRPPAHSMMLKPKVPPNPVLKQETAPTHTLPHQPPILIKQEKSASKKEKGPNKDELLKKAEQVLDAYLDEDDVSLEDAVQKYKALNIPDKYAAESLSHTVAKSLQREEEEAERVTQLVNALASDGVLDAVRGVLSRLTEIEEEIPRAKSRFACLLAYLLKSNKHPLSLSALAENVEGGRQYPLFLLLLQSLHRLLGKNELLQMFMESKIALLTMLPEGDRTKERLGEVLDERGLSYLQPLLRIQSELRRALMADPNPTSFYRWLKDADNVNPDHHTDPAFINALVGTLIDYICTEEGVEQKPLLQTYSRVLQAFLHDHPDLQLHALYAVQVYAHSKEFPKGLILRWFMNLYELEIVEEEAFLKWKEDITDEYAGKGKALFQVNQWLTWLEEAEYEEEEDEDDVDM